jgi:hypothetical protein
MLAASHSRAYIPAENIAVESAFTGDAPDIFEHFNLVHDREQILPRSCL